MSFKAQWYRDKLAKKRQKGFRGYPVATVAYYEPDDDSKASKVSVGIVPDEGADVEVLDRWTSDAADVRTDGAVNEAVLQFVEANGAKTVVGLDRIIGCPHEEGVDYPVGGSCPRCPFWEHRDRWGGVKR